jgi:hypothetical protein
MITNVKWKLNLAAPILAEDRAYVKKPFSIAKQIAKNRNNLPLSNFANTKIHHNDQPKRSATVLPQVQKSGSIVNPNSVI